MGRLTRDPDIRYSSGENGMEVARYTLAVDRRFRRNDGQQSADFIGCVAFGKSAEFAEKYLKKRNQDPGDRKNSNRKLYEPRRQ